MFLENVTAYNRDKEIIANCTYRDGLTPIWYVPWIPLVPMLALFCFFGRGPLFDACLKRNVFVYICNSPSVAVLTVLATTVISLDPLFRTATSDVGERLVKKTRKDGPRPQRPENPIKSNRLLNLAVEDVSTLFTSAEHGRNSRRSIASPLTNYFA